MAGESYRGLASTCYTSSAAEIFIEARGDDTVGNPHRAQISQFELFERILLLKLDKQCPVEQFEVMVSQSTVPSPPLIFAAVQITKYTQQ